MNHEGNDRIAKTIGTADHRAVQSMLTTWNDGSEAGDRFAREFAKHFLPILSDLEKLQEELSTAREALLGACQLKFAQEFVGDNGSFSLSTLEDLLVARKNAWRRRLNMHSSFITSLSVVWRNFRHHLPPATLLLEMWQ